MTLTHSQRGRNWRRVKRGAAWLDEVHPGWYKEIDDAKLDLNHPCQCVLGQMVRHVYPRGDFYSAIGSNVADAVVEPISMSMETANQRGFHVNTEELDIDYDVHKWDTSVTELYQHLTKLWRNEINKRKGS